jgi:molecular chaperone GrpE
MSDERREASAPQGDAQVKVNDRRRFTPEGEPVDPAGPGASPAAGEEQASAAAPAPDDRDRRLAEQAARIDELSRAYAGLLDDNKAFRQRMEREKVRVIEAERASVAQALLEAADDLERALAAVSGSDDGEGPAVRALLDGVRLSLGALHKRIAEIGAVRIPVSGQPFDPRVAEAVDTVAVASADQDGLVVQEVRAGWRIGDRVLRPARVRVGRLARA